MKLKKGDRVEVVWRSELYRGAVTQVVEATDEIVVKLAKKPLMDYLFNQNQVSKVKLVKVPRFIADWISHCEKWELWHAMDYGIDSMPEDVREWLFKAHDNQKLFARAWLDGYEVEQEPLYYVKFFDEGLGFLNVYRNGARLANSPLESEGYKTKFTELEIKNMNENYWAFRVPVEEAGGEINDKIL
ncbi:DUF1642 domain-containing protein [Listeria monocytogenes]